MNIDKEPMSAAYRAVFILSIFMMLGVFLGSVLEQSKAGGFGVWVWGYTAWLMTKRRNSELATLFKFLMWRSVVGLAACALIFLNSADRSTGGNAVGVVVAALSLLLCIAIEYGLFTFFKKQVNAATVPIQTLPSLSPASSPPNHLNRTVSATNANFAQALSELDGGNQDKGLWARCYADADGDDSRAKAAYLKHRATELANHAFELVPANNLPEVQESKRRMTISEWRSVKKSSWIAWLTLTVFFGLATTISLALNPKVDSDFLNVLTPILTMGCVAMGFWFIGLLIDACRRVPPE